jgi:hypothetical protein
MYESGTLLIFKVKGQGGKFLPQHPCEHSRINILQWILTKLGTYLVLRRVWNPIYFQGQRSRSPTMFYLHCGGQFYRYLYYDYDNKGNAKCGVSPRLKIKPCDLDL